MTKSLPYWIILAVIAAMAWTLAQSLHSGFSFLNRDVTDDRPALAELNEFDNQVSFRRMMELVWRGAYPSLLLYNNDLIRTAEESTAQVQFKRHDSQLNLSPNTTVIIQDPEKERADFSLVFLTSGGVNVQTARSMYVKVGHSLVRLKEAQAKIDLMKDKMKIRVNKGKGTWIRKGVDQTIEKVDIPPSFELHIEMDPDQIELNKAEEVVLHQQLIETSTEDLKSIDLSQNSPASNYLTLSKAGETKLDPGTKPIAQPTRKPTPKPIKKPVKKPRTSLARGTIRVKEKGARVQDHLRLATKKITGLSLRFSSRKKMGDGMIYFRGTGANPKSHYRINKERLRVKSDGSFSHQIKAKAGLNLIVLQEIRANGSTRYTQYSTIREDS